MEWRGIPFPETVERIVTNTSLAIDKIPKVYIDTGDNTWSVTATMIATILGSLIAGSIPAAIAWRTIKKNQESVEKDRAAQQASFDKDRDAQLLIASKSFNAQVLSTNRQVWINELRNIISEFVSLIDLYINTNYKFKVETKRFEKFEKAYNSQLVRTDSINNELKSAQKRWDEYRKEKEMQDKALKTIITKSSLMLNPKEVYYTKIITLMNKMFSLPKQIVSVEYKDILSMYTTIDDMSNELVSHTQECLKEEWEKVKTGK
ncbi:hypothetical protein ACNSO7_21655 [Yersinia enterocolitica]|uniref:hypothetical protein n=1 Tax=Yersinia enterocolitica TaxID=630 RepID=UPI003AB309E8